MDLYLFNQLKVGISPMGYARRNGQKTERRLKASETLLGWARGQRPTCGAAPAKGRTKCLNVRSGAKRLPSERRHPAT